MKRAPIPTEELITWMEDDWLGLWELTAIGGIALASADLLDGPAVQGRYSAHATGSTWRIDLVQARLIAAAIPLMLLIFLVGGCIFPDRGTAIANDIREARHPLIDMIEYGGDDDDSGPTIEISLRPGATKEEARAIMCDVVMPAIARGSPPDSFGVIIFDSEGEYLAHDLIGCP